MHHLKSFADAQANGTIQAFLISITDAFVKEWPNVTSECKPGKEETPLDALRMVSFPIHCEESVVRTYQSHLQRIGWWFQNRTWANSASKSNTATAMLDLTQQRPQLLYPY